MMSNKKRRNTDIHSLPHLGEFRRELRKNLTPAEAAFWKLVKGSKLEGRKFVRQHSVGNYILDFYCASEKLAIELDGARHFSGEGAAEDRERTAWLKSRGISVVRFENREVFEETEWVLDVIRSNFRFGPPVNFTAFAPHRSVRNVKTTPSVSSKNDETATPPS
ncbi:MAG TPA: endonuclease domain-containing protein [Pyrinomonadaceae bacterium]|nr:endonuclease domain-containing protein [Pyrinomonadaceae bacterium]